MASREGPLRLLHLITSLNVGGAQMHLYRTVTSFHPERIASTVVSLVPPGKVGELLAAAGVPVLDLGMRPGRPSPLALVRLAGLLKSLRPHILQTYLYHADLLGYLAGKWANIPTILWNVRQSRMDFHRYRRSTEITVRLCARLSRGVKKILVNSFAGLKAHALLGYDAERMLVVPNGFDLTRFRPHPPSHREVRQELGLAPEARLVGLVARFDPQKDHGTFLQAARQVIASQPGTYFLLAGQGVSPDNPGFAKLLQAAPVSLERVRLLGERADMPRLLDALDVMVSASAYGEGFANVIGEAMACGVPCVVTDVGDSALIVGDTGMVVPPQQPEALARAIGEALAWPAAERTRRSVAAQTRLQEKFDITKIAARLETFYLGLAGPSLA